MRQMELRSRCSANDGDSVLTEEQAKTKVLDAAHWAMLGRLCAMQYAYHPSFPDEALNFVLEKLEENGWRRVRTWRGLGSFQAFLVQLVRRLLVDFQRAKFGHMRAPALVRKRAQQHPLWSEAYELLARKGLRSHEAVECLLTRYPDKRRRVLLAIVREVVRAMPERRPASQAEVQFENIDSIRCQPPPEEPALSEHSTKLLRSFIRRYVLSAKDRDPWDNDKSVREFAQRLAMPERDIAFLRMRFEGNLSIKEIARKTEIKGDPYRHYHRLLRLMRDASEQIWVAM